MEAKHTSITIAGKEISFETGKIARQANGCVIARCGDTMIMSAVTAAKEPIENADFLPLQVVYQEKFSAAGKTAGGFIKREGRPTERETLLARLIDRPLRPMFCDGYYCDTQVVNYVMSFDHVNSPDPLAICAASAALLISDIPFIKPVAAVRVGMINDEFIINPSVEQMDSSCLDLMIAGTEDGVLMIEGYCDFLTEEQVLKAIETGHNAIKQICKTLLDWQQEVGKEKKLDVLRQIPEKLFDEVEKIAKPLLLDALKVADKKEREKALSEVSEKVKEALLPQDEEEPKYLEVDVSLAIKKITSKHMRQMILSEKVRSDGRTTTEIRPISIETSILPRAHGSTLFTRGETQSIAVCTLGGESMAQRFETMLEEGARRFYLQYFFPPFSVGETGRIGPASRREIGHGKLAERALQTTLPSKEEFPYVIRLESNITESNGSSSMASVCGGCLALMDAGVPIRRPVSGIAMGLILEKDQYVVLSDILGVEDALGDMDFKITGDQEGITAFQMDIKVEGITLEIMETALRQAKEGRIHILNKMLDACPQSKELSMYAPRIETIKVKPSKIAIIIGPGGKQIRSIVEETGAEINIDDDGTVSITSDNADSMKRAREIIEGLVAEVEIGKTYTGKIVSIVPFGCFVEVLPGKEGLCHISEFDHQRIEDLNEYAKPGDKITVKVLDINDRGQIKLSRKAALLRKK